MENNNIHRERTGTAARKERLLAELQAYLDENAARPLSLQDVANHFHISVSSITQLFQKYADCTFHRYLTRRRIALAEELIDQGTPLEEVGRLVGYMDHSSFYRAFKQLRGISPRDYKKGKREP